MVNMYCKICLYTNKLIVIFQRNNQKKMSDASKLHQQELYNEKLANKKNEVDKHVKNTLSSRKKNKKQKTKKNDRDTNVISRIENVNKRDFDMEYNFGKIEKVHTIELIIDLRLIVKLCQTQVMN